MYISILLCKEGNVKKIM